MPIYGLSYSLYYNTAMFEAAGITTPPATWDEFVEDAKKLTIDTDGDGQIDQWGVTMAGSSITNNAHQAFVRGLQNGGSLYDDDGNPDFGNDGVVTGVKEWVDLMAVDKVVSPSDAESVNGSDMAATFAEGQAAMFFDQAPGDNLKSRNFTDYAAAPVPMETADATGLEGTQSHVAGINVSVFENSGNKEAAIDFVKHLTSDDEQKYLNESFGSLPVVTDRVRRPGVPDGRHQAEADDPRGPRPAHAPLPLRGTDGDPGRHRDQGPPRHRGPGRLRQRGRRQVGPRGREQPDDHGSVAPSHRAGTRPVGSVSAAGRTGPPAPPERTVMTVNVLPPATAEKESAPDPHQLAPIEPAKRKKHRSPLAYFLVAPAALAELLVHIVPMVLGIWIAFITLNQLSIANWVNAPFVGLQNFVTALDPSSPIAGQLYGALGRTLLFTVIVVAIAWSMGMLGAVLLTSSFKGRGLLRTLFLVPYALPSYVGTIAWAFMFNQRDGAINRFLVDDLGILQDRPVLAARRQLVLGDRHRDGLAVLALRVPDAARGAAEHPGRRLRGRQPRRRQPLEAVHEHHAADGQAGQRRLLLIMSLWIFNQFNVPYVLFGPASPEQATLISPLIYQQVVQQLELRPRRCHERHAPGRAADRVRVLHPDGPPEGAERP